MSEPISNGKLEVVGVGPGDPELMTLKAARLIEAADVIAYPTNSDGQSFARDIAASHLSEQVEIGFYLPMRTERAPAQIAYEGACGKIAAELDAGRAVVLLCEGDPFFYGSAMYVFARLAETYPVSVTPGISSLTACAAAIGRPLASRSDVLSVIPATLDEDRLREAISKADSMAIIKVGRYFSKVCHILEELGRAQQAVVIESATLNAERISLLDGFAEDERPYFSTILVGPTTESFVRLPGAKLS